MYVCLYPSIHVSTHGHHIQQAGHQPGWLPKLLVGSFSLSPLAPESLVSRDRLAVPSPASACSFSTLRLDLVLTHGIPPAFLHGVHFLILSTAIWSVPSLSGHAIAYRWRSLPRVCLKVVSETGAAFSGITICQFLCASLFPHRLLVQWICCLSHNNSSGTNPAVLTR